MPRVIWKAAISFGLVHVPVALHAVTTGRGIDFDWLDSRSMDSVGDQRIHKRTGKAIDKAHVVRGVQVEDGRDVVLSDDEVKAAYPRSTQTIGIECFVAPTQIPFTDLERPDALAPLPKGEQVDALLREAMLAAGVVGIARVVLHTREHLAALLKRSLRGRTGAGAAGTGAGQPGGKSPGPAAGTTAARTAARPGARKRA